jgi:hypothetical protein
MTRKTALNSWRLTYNREEARKHNSTYKKLAVQWLNETLCFVSSSVLADSFRLRNRQLLVAAKRCRQFIPFPRRKSISIANVWGQIVGKNEVQDDKMGADNQYFTKR